MGGISVSMDKGQRRDGGLLRTDCMPGRKEGG